MRDVVETGDLPCEAHVEGLRSMLEAETILEGMQGVEGVLNGSSFRRVDCLGEEQFPSTSHERLLGDSNPLR
jgi:hypothetical protein